MGYGESGIIGYRVFIIELNDDIAGVNCMFDEIIPECTEDYYITINFLKIEMAKDEKNIESCMHSAGTNTLTLRTNSCIRTRESHCTKD